MYVPRTRNDYAFLRMRTCEVVEGNFLRTGHIEDSVAGQMKQLKIDLHAQHFEE